MPVRLTVAGKVYTRWTSVRVTRSLKRAVSDFELEVPGELVPSILPFQACTIDESGDLLLTGYVVSVEPEIGARETRTRISGQSKTQDLVDCMLGFGTNQFSGNTLAAIAAAVAQPFGIGTVLGAGVDIGDAFPDATYERSETAFGFLERLARQRAVLLTDDEAGNLVMTTAGTARAPADLRMGPGGNVARAQGKLDGKGRFSTYSILSQVGIKQTGSDVQTGIEGQASDSGVPRFRPWVGMAESALMPGDAQSRAQWEAAHRVGAAVSAVLTVPEWRANGTLWDINQLARCTVPRLALDDEYLVGKVEFREDHEGRRTLLTVSPPSAYTPEPATNAGLGNGAWAGIVKVAP